MSESLFPPRNAAITIVELEVSDNVLGHWYISIALIVDSIVVDIL